MEWKQMLTLRGVPASQMRFAMRRCTHAHACMRTGRSTSPRGLTFATQRRSLGISSSCAAELPVESRSMRAVVLPAPGGPPSSLQLRTLPVRPPDAGEVTVRVDACAVAYRDILDRQGAFKFIQKNAVLGHEMAATITAVGDGAKGIGREGRTWIPQVGQRVVSLHWDQSEAWPSPLLPTGPVSSFLGLTTPGGYAEYCTASAGCFVPVPSKWSGSAAEAAPVMSTFGTVWQGAIVRAGVEAKDNVLVTGATGGVGSSAIKICKRLGCNVTAVTTSPAKEKFLKDMGADQTVIIPSDGSFNRHQAVQDIPPSVVVECTGGPTFDASLRSLSPEGRLVLVGNVNNSNIQLPLGLCILKSLSVVGSDSISARNLLELFEFIDEGKDSSRAPLRPHLHSVLPLEEVQDAHEMLQQKNVVGRVVLQISDDTWL